MSNGVEEVSKAKLKALLAQAMAAATFASLLTLPSAAQATVYYVSLTGNDSSAGTSTSSAWRSISKVNATTFQAGDAILFRGGQTFDGTIFLTPATVVGASSTPTKIASYGGGRATLTSSQDAVITIGDLGNIEVTDLNLTASRAGISAYNDTASTRFYSIQLTNLDIHALSVGIYVQASGLKRAAGFSDVVIRNVNIRGPARAASTRSGKVDHFALRMLYRLVGLFIGKEDRGGAGIYIVGNDTAPFSHQNVVMDGIHISGHGGDGIAVVGVDGLVIQNGLIHDGGGEWSEAIELNYVNNALVQYNEAYNQAVTAGGGDGGGIDLDESVTNSIVQFNYVHDNAGPGFSAFQGKGIPWANNVFRYNISENNGRGPTNVPCEMVIGAYGQNDITGLQVYGNTFYTSVGRMDANSILRFEAANSAGIIANNIFYVQGTNPRLIDTGRYDPANMMFRGNTYYTSDPVKIIWASVLHSALNEWQTATGQEQISGVSVARTENPRLANPGGGGVVGGYDPEKLRAYKLQPGSPAIDAGLDIRALFGIDYGLKDFYGVPIPQNGQLDIGASEAEPGGP